MRFSGHETFPFRYAWLPKACRQISNSDTALAEDELAMQTLGLGKNMVNAVRFWLDATKVAVPAAGRRFSLTTFGAAIFANDGGYDPFIEDVRTLWLLHWNIASQQDLFAWQFLFNQWHHPEISRSEVLATFQREVLPQARSVSAVTLAQHFDVFLRTYLRPSGRGAKVDEDVLDCPLASLGLIQQVGERRADASGRSEPVYRFWRDSKPEITPALFAYCVDDFWTRCYPAEETLAFRQIAVAPWSPGQLLKLPEEDLRSRLESIETDTQGAFSFRASAAHPALVRTKRQASDLLSAVYQAGALDA